MINRLRAAVTVSLGAVLLAGCGGDDSARTNSLGFPDGSQPVDDELTFVEGLGLYVVAPAVILLLVAALAWLPGMVRSSRYRPGRGWSAAPLWFGGPADPAAAVQQAQTGDLVRGGASGDW